jgi:hypothetical protein
MTARRLTFALLLALTSLFGVQFALAQSGNSWRVDFFANPDWSGAPAYTTFTNSIAYNWTGMANPAPGVPADNFSARFTTSAFFYAGTYNFSVTADDEIVLYVDGNPRLDTRGQGLSGKTIVATVNLTQATHNIQLDYRQYTGPAYVFLKWEIAKAPTPPTPVPATPVPAPTPVAANCPASASSVTTQFGNYTPCIAQGLHQASCFQSNGAWDAPNLGSIQMEPKIEVWGNCTANKIETRQLYCNAAPQSAVCSRTEAGWFPR